MRRLRNPWTGLLLMAALAVLAAMPTAIEYAVMAGISLNGID
jgi:hypothetical protein